MDYKMEDIMALLIHHRDLVEDEGIPSVEFPISFSKGFANNSIFLIRGEERIGFVKQMLKIFSEVQSGAREGHEEGHERDRYEDEVGTVRGEAAAPDDSSTN